ncbi:MAG: hypothetical protein MZV63_63215 [Marinilabiliales bacterium]|nr:hypothetical protein [Marinilabiliales bacterium]
MLAMPSRGQADVLRTVRPDEDDGETAAGRSCGTDYSGGRAGGDSRS